MADGHNTQVRSPAKEQAASQVNRRIDRRARIICEAYNRASRQKAILAMTPCLLLAMALMLAGGAPA